MVKTGGFSIFFRGLFFLTHDLVLLVASRRGVTFREGSWIERRRGDLRRGGQADSDLPGDKGVCQFGSFAVSLMGWRAFRGFRTW